jgi:transposase
MAKIINYDTAGIDVSSRDHYVAVPEGRTKDAVRRFGCFTRDLHELARFLKACGIKSVAMESTGVYWYHLYTVLLDYGLEVYLVNARHVKNVPGRKSDVSDARWLQQLHSFGLLNGCFQPDNLTRELRNYVRQRKTLVRQMTTEVQRMQKALEQMNIKLNNVVSDLQGKTGIAIIAAILGGERNPGELAKLRDRRIKASKEVFLKSLEGTWRAEHLFNLELAWEQYHFLDQQLVRCDNASEAAMRRMEDSAVPNREIKHGQKYRSKPKFNAAQSLYQALGVDVTEIFGLSSTTALTVFSETGPALKEKFPTQKQFLSWLNVVPNNKITGGKVISSKVGKKKNRAGQAFREAANGLWNAKNELGDYIRSKKSRKGAGSAVVATAKKLAAIYYVMVTEKIDFKPQLLKNKNEEYLRIKLKKLENAIMKTKSLLDNNQNVTTVVR